MGEERGRAPNPARAVPERCGEKRVLCGFCEGALALRVVSCATPDDDMALCKQR
jgi:hypothetical protein